MGFFVHFGIKMSLSVSKIMQKETEDTSVNGFLYT